MADISKFSDGTNEYDFKDASARASLNNLSAVASTGSYSDLSHKPVWSIDDDGNLTYTEGE